MKQRLLAFITVLFILFLASNCAGTKPFYKAGNAPGLTFSHTVYTTQLNRHIDNYSYVPTPAEENINSKRIKGQINISVSFPASFKFEF